jgi:hypothetical protein
MEGEIVKAEAPLARRPQQSESALFPVEAMGLAKQLAGSTLIPKALQGKPGDVLVVLLTGREFGLGPMQSLRGIHVVEGKAVMAADLMVGLCAARREVCEFFTLVESTAKRAVYRTKRVGAPEAVTMVWTVEQAQAAGLTGKHNWKAYPEAMLRARCASALARAVYPDLMAGTYDPDELAQPASPTPHHEVQHSEEPAPQHPTEPEAPKAKKNKPAKRRTIEESERVDRARELVGFGTHKSKPIAKLSDVELGEAMDEGADLVKQPRDWWTPAVENKVDLLALEYEARADRVKDTLADEARGLMGE